MKVFLDTIVLIAAFATRVRKRMRTFLTQHELVVSELVPQELDRVPKNRLTAYDSRVVARR